MAYVPQFTITPALLAEVERVAALRAYEALQARLRHDLDIDPPTHLIELYQQLRQTK